MVVNLSGIAENMNIKLEKKFLTMENTFISLHDSKTFKIINKSDLMVHFIWKQYCNEIEEEHQKSRRLVEISEEEKQANKMNSQISKKLEKFDRAISKRDFKNKKREIIEYKFGFENDIFKIHPLEGTIWPGLSVDITVTFNPSSAGECKALPYCEIQGRESRLPLQLKVFQIS